MKIGWTVLTVVLTSPWTTAAAQVVIAKPKVVKVQVERPHPPTVELTSPVPGKVYRDTLIHVEGVVLHARPGARVWVHLGDTERELPVGEGGRFSTAAPLRVEGVNRLLVDPGGVPQEMKVMYQPAPAALTLSPATPWSGTLHPGERVQVKAEATFHTGEVRAVTAETAGRCDGDAGRVEDGGWFVAVKPGRAKVTAVYRDSAATIPIQVVAPEPPPPSDGLVNLTVKTPQVTLDVWDGEAEDGDILTISLNGVVVVSKLEIFHRPQRFFLTLQPGLNRVEILAENEGTSPPNTAAIRVAPEGEDGVTQKYEAYQKTRSHFTIVLVGESP